MTQIESHSPRRARREAQGMARPPAVQPPRQRPANRPVPVRALRRGSHATTYGQGFAWMIIWTIVGAFVPGAGLFAAGWRKVGGFLLTLTGLTVFATLLGLVTGRLSIRTAMDVGLDTDKLLTAAVVVVALAVLQGILILLTNAELRRFTVLTSAQRFFTVVVVLALLTGVGIPTYKVGSYALIQRDLVSSVFTAAKQKGKGPDTSKSDPWAKFPRVNVLLIGSDAGADRIGVRPDTLILASIDTKTGNTVLFSLPRNLERVPFPSGTPGARAWPNGYYCPDHSCLLNAIWTWAEDRKDLFPGDQQPGLTATRQAVQATLGLPVHYYAMLNLRGFQQVVDAIGGVTVNVYERLPIGGNSTYHVATGGWIEKGMNQHLDGYHALWFARSRWSTTDYDRMRRQRCVIAAVVDQANPVKVALAFPDIAKAAKKNLSTDIPQADLEAWVDLTMRVKKARVESLPFTDQVISSRSNPDFAQIRDIVDASIAASTRPQASATPTPSTSAAPSATPSSKKKVVTPTYDPTTAQDVKQVC